MPERAARRARAVAALEPMAGKGTLGETVTAGNDRVTTARFICIGCVLLRFVHESLSEELRGACEFWRRKAEAQARRFPPNVSCMLAYDSEAPDACGGRQLDSR